MIGNQEYIEDFKQTMPPALLTEGNIRNLVSLECCRNFGDYDDFRAMSKSDAEENYKRTLSVFKAVVRYLDVDRLEMEIAYYVNLEDIEDFKSTVPSALLTEGSIKDLAETYYKTIMKEEKSYD